jgi:hypothetical protein
MVVAPRETIVRKSPFIDLTGRMPCDLKGTVIIRVGSKPFDGFFEPIVINPADPRDVAEPPGTIVIMKLTTAEC